MNEIDFIVIDDDFSFAERVFFIQKEFAEIRRERSYFERVVGLPVERGKPVGI